MPQLIQYLCPSWRLSLYGRPSALSRWSDRPVIQYDRAQLLRLNVEEDSTERLVWEGTTQELQDLQDILQNYVQDLLQRSHQAFVAAESPELRAERVGQFHRTLNPDLNPELNPELSPNPELAESGVEISLAPEIPETQTQEASPEVEPLPLMRLEAVGTLGHSLFLPPDITLSLSTLECFDLAEILDQWQTETLNLPDLPQEPPARVSPWLKTAALILVTVGVSSSVSVVGLKWWQQQESEVAQSQATSADLTLENLAPLPGLEGAIPYTPVPRLPSEFYGPPAPGQPDVSLGLEIQGETPLPSGSFAGISMPPPPDFSTLPPPPPAYSSASGESYPTYGPEPIYTEPAGTYEDYGYNDYGEQNADTIASLPPAPELSRSARSEVPISPAAAPALESAPALGIDGGANSGTDNTVRIGEIAGYFQGQWQPPKNLTGALEYQLLIGADGTLQAITPLSDRAGNFLDRTGIPLLGEPIASPGSDLLVTIVFYPQGGVDVF